MLNGFLTTSRPTCVGGSGLTPTLDETPLTPGQTVGGPQRTNCVRLLAGDTTASSRGTFVPIFRAGRSLTSTTWMLKILLRTGLQLDCHQNLYGQLYLSHRSS